MKRTTLILIMLLPLFSFGQVLLETLEGEEIVINSLKFPDSLRIITNVNSSAETIQAKGYIVLDPGNITSKSNLVLTYKVKPSEGVSKLISNGTINSNMTFGTTWSRYLGAASYINITASYNIEKSTLFHPDWEYGKGIDEFNYKGLSLLGAYNRLIAGSILGTISFGYARKNNYSDLTKVEVSEVSSIPNPENPNLETIYGSVTDARVGNYKKFDSYPLKVSFTYLPTEDATKKGKLLPGASLYYSSNYGNFIPNHKMGLIVFITKQDSKTGVRAPILGLGTQVNDLTNNLDTGKSFGKRISLNLSATIALL